jgi:arylsulfatase A-like enzyme
LLPALLGESEFGRETLAEQASAVSLRKGKWKFIPVNKGQAFNRNTGTETGNAPAPQLYDLSSDPGERANVAADHPEVVNEMRALLQTLRRDQEPQ